MPLFPSFNTTIYFRFSSVPYRLALSCDAVVRAVAFLCAFVLEGCGFIHLVLQYLHPYFVTLSLTIKNHYLLDFYSYIFFQNSYFIIDWYYNKSIPTEHIYCSRYMVMYGEIFLYSWSEICWCQTKFTKNITPTNKQGTKKDQIIFLLLRVWVKMKYRSQVTTNTYWVWRITSSETEKSKDIIIISLLAVSVLWVKSYSSGCKTLVSLMRTTIPQMFFVVVHLPKHDLR